jgi:hypothetical protein
MGSVSTANFCKHKTCPSAETLLSYTRATLTHEQRQQLTAHFDACDFCDAELYLLSKFPPAGTTVYPSAKIPSALYRLALRRTFLHAGCAGLSFMPAAPDFPLASILSPANAPGLASNRARTSHASNSTYHLRRAYSSFVAPAAGFAPS